MDQSKPLRDRFSIVINLDLMLENRQIYAENFLVIPGEYIVEFLKKVAEAYNFLRIASAPIWMFSTMPVMTEISMSSAFEIFPMFPSMSKVWIII